MKAGPLPPLAVAAALCLAALPAPAQDPLQARALAATCAGCHGTEGRALGDLPTLAGQPADKLLAKLNDFRTGGAPATVMHQIARGYTDEQLRLLAGWFAAQKGR